MDAKKKIRKSLGAASDFELGIISAESLQLIRSRFPALQDEMHSDDQAVD